MRLGILCPSRGRPEQIKEVVASFLNNIEDSQSELIFIIDEDDTKLEEYCLLIDQIRETAPNIRRIIVPRSGGMTNAVNRAFWQVWHDFDVIGFIGDDHRIKTAGFDRKIVDLLQKTPGIVYGNDLLQGANLPTQVFMNKEIPLSLGWFALPGTHHLYVDNAWRDLGLGAGCLTYLPDLIIEHLHPSTGKAEWDEEYRRVNSDAMYQHDSDVYNIWYTESRPVNIEIVKDAIDVLTCKD